MPRYDALIQPTLMMDRYDQAKDVFKRTSASLFSYPDHPLTASSFMGPEPQVSHDLPEGVEVVFTLWLHDSYERQCLEEDDEATRLVDAIRDTTGVEARVMLIFARVGYSFTTLNDSWLAPLFFTE